MASIENEREHLEFQRRILQNISHDIRTNLNEITGYLEFLERRELEENEYEHLFEARRATRSLRYSVDKLLNFTALNARELELRREWFYFDDLIVEAAEFAAELAGDKGLKLVLEIESGSRLVYGDAERMEEMLRYLLENAVKYTSKGRVLLKVTRQDEEGSARIGIVIRDTGIGMSPAELKEVCEPYVRFVEGEKGLGLGLYFAQTIAEKMGAFLRMESVPKEGTTVRLDLRMDSSESAEGGNASALRDKKLVFFLNPQIRTHPEVQALTRKVLTDLGMRVEFFTEEEAFSQYLLGSSEAPDIVSVATLPDDYERFGMLFAFLRKSRKYARTIFVAERLGKRRPPRNFDRSFEGHAGVRGYLEALKRPEEAHPEAGMRILIVDDLASNINILKLFLSKIAPEAEVDSALGGYEAIGMYRNRRYDLIFLDLKMPGLDGFQVLERFRQIAPPPPVYAITAEVYESTRKELEASGFEGLLEKPYSAERLKHAVMEAAANAKNR